MSFSIDPNFRGWSDGTHRVLWNAILGSATSGGRVGLESARRIAAIDRATSAARALAPVGSSPLRAVVAAGDARGTAALIRRWGVEGYRMPLADGVLFQVANRRDLSNEEHRFVDLLRLIGSAGIHIRWASVP